MPDGDGAVGAAYRLNLSDEWSSLKPQITQRGLQRDSGLAERAMDMVFRIERQTSNSAAHPPAQIWRCC